MSITERPNQIQLDFKGLGTLLAKLLELELHMKLEQCHFNP